MESDKYVVLLAEKEADPKQSATVWENHPLHHLSASTMPAHHVLEKGTRLGSRHKTRTLTFRDRHTQTEWRLELTLGRATRLWRRMGPGGQKVRWHHPGCFGTKHFHRLVSQISADPSVQEVSRVFGK